MIRKVTIIFSALIGLSLGYTLGPVLWSTLNLNQEWLGNPLANAIIFGLLFIMLGILIAPLIEKGINRLSEFFAKQKTSHIILGTLGLLLGLGVGYLIALPFINLNIPVISNILPFISSFSLALVGLQLALTRKDELMSLFSRPAKPASDQAIQGEMLERRPGDNFYKYKLLDTSVIIDGRILEVVKANFLEGILVIPNFVLEELQHIADSSDSLTRAKGRRGLDILNEMQNENLIPIEFYDGDFEDIAEVDSKLVRLAKLIDAAIVTNDYNLNKVSEFQNIKVFNINELANAVKPVLIPGEELYVQVIKPGTERKQGVAYLDDGTMIVVEDGQYYMNKQIRVVVTSAIQTAAGRMIFAKPTHSSSQLSNEEGDKND